MFIFTNRAEYLVQVAQWKADYAALSKEIRALKHEIKKQSRDQGYTYLWYDLKSMKDSATTMVYERHESKVEANRQYQEAKTVTEA